MVIELHIDIHSIIAILILVAEVQTLLNFFHILPFQVKFVFILPKNTLIYHTQCILQQIYKIYLVSNIHWLSWVNFQKEGNMPGNNLQDWTNIDFLMKIILKYNYSSWSQLFPYFCLFFMFVCLNLVIHWMSVTEICETGWCDFSATSSRSFVMGRNIKFIFGKPWKASQKNWSTWTSRLNDSFNCHIYCSNTFFFSKSLFYSFSHGRKYLEPAEAFCRILLVLFSCTSFGPMTFLCHRGNVETVG